jgi:hypothetical protein
MTGGPVWIARGVDGVVVRRIASHVVSLDR